MAAQASKIALGPVKIISTGQQSLIKKFQNLSFRPVDLTVHREDCDLSENFIADRSRPDKQFYLVRFALNALVSEI